MRGAVCSGPTTRLALPTRPGWMEVRSNLGMGCLSVFEIWAPLCPEMAPADEPGTRPGNEAWERGLGSRPGNEAWERGRETWETSGDRPAGATRVEASPTRPPPGCPGSPGAPAAP